MSGYQRLKMTLSSPFSVRTRVCNNKCAPGLDHCICCFLQKRLLTTSFTKPCRDHLAMVIPLPVIRYHVPVVPNIRAQRRDPCVTHVCRADLCVGRQVQAPAAPL